MLGAREKALLEDLKKWRSEINKMIRQLNKVLKPKSGKLETGEAEKVCLQELEDLKKKIEETLDQHRTGVWPLKF